MILGQVILLLRLGKNMKKVAVLLGTLPIHGGSHQYAHLFMDALMENTQIKILALCENIYWYKWCKEAGINCKKITWNKQNYNNTLKEIKYFHYYKYFYSRYDYIGRLLKREKIDVLAVTYHKYIPGYNVKTVVPVHDLMHRYERRFDEVSNDYENREHVHTLQAKFATRILTDSDLGKKQFEESYKDYLSKKLEVCSVPFAVPYYIENMVEEKIETPSKYVFYPAQFWKHKNHINLLKAISIVKEKIPDIQLVLSGSEKNNGSNIRKMIRESELENNVRILGYVTNEQMTYLYRHAIIMVMPSYFGPTNIPPLEAMALGCPVAVSNNYAMPEQVGDAGMTFNPDSPEEIAECIIKAWNNEELRCEMIKKGYEQAKKFSPYQFRNRINYIINNM